MDTIKSEKNEIPFSLLFLIWFSVLVLALVGIESQCDLHATAMRPHQKSIG